MRLLDRLLEDSDDIDLVVRRFRRAALGAWLGFPGMASVGMFIEAWQYDQAIMVGFVAAGAVFSLIQALQALDLKQTYHRLRLRAELEQAGAAGRLGDDVPRTTPVAQPRRSLNEASIWGACLMHAASPACRAGGGRPAFGPH